MARFEVTFTAPVIAFKTIVVEASDEDEAYNTAYALIEEPYYQNPSKWELEFSDAAQVDDIEEVETTSVTRS